MTVLISGVRGQKSSQSLTALSGESLAYKTKLSGVSEPTEMANALRVNQSSA